jgi:hypothetical protein
MLEFFGTSPAPVGKKHRSRPASTNIQLEQIQAWLLLAQYEFLRRDEHQAMLTAGRGFRLVLLGRLFEVDSPVASFRGAGDLDDPNNSNDPSSLQSAQEPFSKTEEKRRAFWMAYGLDQFLSSRNDNEWPVTLDEETVSKNNLPCLELIFDWSTDPNTPSRTRGKLPEQPTYSDRLSINYFKWQWTFGYDHTFRRMHASSNTIRTMHVPSEVSLFRGPIKRRM